MPIYEYLCESCGFQFEEVQKFSDSPLEECPDCGKNSASRQVSISAFHLKGGGWYKDGYSNKESEDKKSITSDKEKDSSKNSSDSKAENSASKENQTKSEKKESVPNKNSSSSKNKKEKAA